MVEKEIGAPHVKTKLIEIEGADGSIDLTDFFGEPKYGDVTHKFVFKTIVPRNDFLSHYSQVKNALHGKKMRIILDDDPTFYYVGRCYVSSFTNEKNIGMITVECECEPYKHKKDETVAVLMIDGSETFYVPNAKRRAVPIVTVETDTTLNIVFGSYNVWDLGSGSYTLPELELAEGDNSITLTGTGTVTLRWREGSL